MKSNSGHFVMKNGFSFSTVVANMGTGVCSARVSGPRARPTALPTPLRPRHLLEPLEESRL